MSTGSPPADSPPELPVGVPPGAVQLEFVRARGPGGQNVNKVETAVQLRLLVAATELPESVQQRLLQLAGSRATKEGSVIIRADRFRTQARNRADAFARLQELVQRAWERPKRRLATQPTRAARQRRTDSKAHRGAVKRLRGKPARDD